MRTGPFEKRKQWKRDYNARRWQDPEFRKRHNEVAKISARRRRLKRLGAMALYYPYGFSRRGVYSMPALFDAFAEHLQLVFNPQVARAYRAFPFDPFRSGAPELFRRTLRGAAELMDGKDPVYHSNTPNAVILPPDYHDEKELEHLDG